MKTLIRITTVPMAFKVLLPGQPSFMEKNGFRVIMISADGPELKDVIEHEKCPHIIVPMTRSITPVKDLICLVKLMRIFRKYKPDIVHTHTPKAGLLGMLAAKLCGVKIRIHTIGGLPIIIATGLKRRVLKFTERLTSGAANHIWPNCQSLKDYMIEERLAKPSKLEMIRNGSTNGIDLNRFNRDNLNVQLLEQIKSKINYEKIKDSFKILCVGRMVRDKGIEELISVFKTLQRKYPVHLILIGPFEAELDPLNEDTENEIMHNPGITHINWSNDIEYYMSFADLLVHPSHREGFPNVILQSGAMKLPVVCSNIPGNNDIVKDQKTGLLFPVKHTLEFHNAIEFIMNNRTTAVNFADVLYNEVTELYDQKSIHKALLDSYEQLLAKNGKE
jgi:glycosyltransferase involved in cell wall biosynthesis